MEVVAEEDHINHGGQCQGMDRPVIVVVAVHRNDRSRWATIATEASVRLSPQ